MLAVAVIGLVVNGVSLWLLHDAQTGSLTMRGAYLEVAGDAAGSVAVVVAAIVIAVTGRTGADALASALIALLILPRTGVCCATRSTSSSRRHRKASRWPMSAAISSMRRASPMCTTSTRGRSRRASTSSRHTSCWSPARDGAAVLDFLCECLSGDFDIEHSTFQLESSDRRRLEAGSHG